MGLTDIVRSERIFTVTYGMFYELKERPNSGYSFDCTKDGELLSEPLPEVAAHLIAEAHKYHAPQVVEYESSYREPAHGKCVCGRTVYLERDYGHGIDCDCGRIYNSSGQELAPRSQWDDRYDDDSTQPYWAEFGHLED
jgi:hypothetical protein